jgi:hypothetical protein
VDSRLQFTNLPHYCQLQLVSFDATNCSAKREILTTA